MNQEPPADRRAGLSEDDPHQLVLQEVQVGRARGDELQLLVHHHPAALPEECRVQRGQEDGQRVWTPSRSVSRVSRMKMLY